MKYLLYSIITLALLIDPNKVGKINTIKSEARKAFMSGDYKTAIQKYSFLLDSLHVNEDEVRLNLASAYYMSKDTANALANYQAVSGSEKNHIRSKAEQQLGVMADKNNKLEEALNHFKQAIKADPSNEDARYNYELVKKRLDEQKKQEEQKNKDKDQKDQKKDDKNKDDKKKDDQKKDDKNKEDQKKDDEKKDDKNKDQKDKEKEKKDQEKKDQEQKEQEEKEKEEKKNQAPPPSKYDQSKAPQLSEAQAKKILEAMKAQEKQYLQQNRRKSTKARDKNKPDW